MTFVHYELEKIDGVICRFARCLRCAPYGVEPPVCVAYSANRSKFGLVCPKCLGELRGTTRNVKARAVIFDLVGKLIVDRQKAFP